MEGEQRQGKGNSACCTLWLADAVLPSPSPHAKFTGRVLCLLAFVPPPRLTKCPAACAGLISPRLHVQRPHRPCLVTGCAARFKRLCERQRRP